MSLAAPAAAPAPLTGWVPRRSSVARPPVTVPVETSSRAARPTAAATTPVVPSAVVPSAVVPSAVAVVPDAVVPDAAISAEAFGASAGWAPEGLAREGLARDGLTPEGLSHGGLEHRGLERGVVERGGLLPGVLDNGRHRRPGPPKPAVLTIPVALRGVRARPRRLAVLGVLVLLVAVAGVFGIRVAWASSSAKPESIPAASHGPPGGLVSRTVPAAFATAGAKGSPTAGATAVSAGVLLVHVIGQVRRPGVVRLPGGSRVLDAVDAAGGATPSADLNHVNLARVLIDGEQIVVPKPGEIVPGPSAAQGAGAGPAGAGSPGGAAAALVNLNSADLAALDSLPGVGPVLSQRILDWRAQHGRFSTVDELGEVSGIGEKLLAQLGPRVTV